MLLKSVTSIAFPCLQILYLENLKITSFDPIHWIDAPHLMALYLMHNHTINLKSLAKTKFDLIAKIEIDGKTNHAQINHLTRMKFTPKTKVNNLSKEPTSNQISNQNPTSLIECMFKLQTKIFASDSKLNLRNLDTLMVRAS